MNKSGEDGMFAEERKHMIVDLVNKNIKTTVNNLCEEFSVSPATIRNDLRELEAVSYTHLDVYKRQVPNNPTGWVAAVQWSAKQKAEELGLNYVLVASDSVNDQANKIDELIQMGCEYIVMMPENDELAVAAQKVLDAGITPVSYTHL